MIVVDFECFKHDWLVCWLDTKTRKMYSIVNDKYLFEKFYNYYKNEIWVTYNGRHYDQWIAKAILADFNPYEVSDWIINQDRKGYEFSNLLNRFPIINYDCAVFGKSLKQLEGFMGHDIRETDVPFDIDRKLTPSELKSTIQYCKHDVTETFEVFVENKNEFEEHMGLIHEFQLPLREVSKSSTQLAAIILGAVKQNRIDEFDIRTPKTARLGKYQFLRDFYKNWAKNDQNYKTMSLETDIAGVPHTFGIGGIHGAVKNYIGDGHYIMADVSSYYPSLMIEYNMLSRNVYDKKRYVIIRDKRIQYKQDKNPKQSSLKLVLNKTYGGSKDKYNNLYDPLQANNVCIAGQLLLVDLIDKLEQSGLCELIQSNTDGILVKVFNEKDSELVKQICGEWETRTRMELEFDQITRVIQKDVNNYIVIFKSGKIKRKGAYVKSLSRLDYDLPIVNEAVVNYLVNGIAPESTILGCNEYIKFQMITKIGKPYEYVSHNGTTMYTRVNRVFASTDHNDGTLYKKKKVKDNLDKVASVPESCFIDNTNILEKSIPTKLDKHWYVSLAHQRIKDFLG